MFVCGAQVFLAIFYGKTIMKKNYIIMAVCIIAAFGGYYWYAQTHLASSAVQYATAPAEKGTLVTSVSGSGNVIVNQSVNIDPTITGTVANLAVNIGDQVKLGQALFTIVNDQLGVNLSLSQAAYAQAQSALGLAQADVEQAKAARAADQTANASSKQKQADKDKIDAAQKAVTAAQLAVDPSSPQLAYAQAQSALESSEASVKQAQATLAADRTANASSKQKKADRDKITAALQAASASQQSLGASGVDLNYQKQQAGERSVTAPMAGTVNAVNIQNGDDLGKLSSGSSRIIPIIIGDLSTMKAQVQINEVDVPNVQLGQKATMTFSAVPNLTVTGKVEKMDSLGTITSGVVTYNATIGFDNLDSRIKSGMSVSAAIITGVEQDVITVPNSAIKTGAGGSYVQVLNSGQKIPEQVSVQVGVANNTDTEIVSGLNVGDNVVTKTINSSSASSTTSSANPGGAAGGIRIPGVGGGGGGGAGRIGG